MMVTTTMTMMEGQNGHQLTRGNLTSSPSTLTGPPVISS